MSLLDVFRLKKQSSASIAKERLQIIVAHERNRTNEGMINLQRLKQRLLDVIREECPSVESDAVNVTLDRDNQHSILELNVTLPDS